VEEQRRLGLSYSEVGASSGTPPVRYNVDASQIDLGTGRGTFVRAVAAVQAWKMFDFDWIELFDPSAPIEVGTVVATLIHSLGLWFLNGTRLVYVIDEERRFGFAYGTLEGHVERGEERFLVEHLPDDTVRYSILAFSRPAHPLVRLGNPYARHLQSRFRSSSMAAMRRNLELDVAVEE